MAPKNLQNVTMVGLAERVKRATSRHDVATKHVVYKNPINIVLAKPPITDWELYRYHVWAESKKWVKDFQQEYKALCETFDARKQQDYSKYYVELAEARREMQADLEKFKTESEKKLKAFQVECDRIKALKPSADKELEEYCELLKKKRKITFEEPCTKAEKPLKRGDEGHGHGQDNGNVTGNKQDGVGSANGSKKSAKNEMLEQGVANQNKKVKKTQPKQRKFGLKQKVLRSFAKANVSK